MRNIREFVHQLSLKGDLQEIGAQVATDQEIAAVTDLVAKSANGGKALLFNNVGGFTWPVATNLFGSAERMALALNVDDLGTLSEKLATGLARYEEDEPEEALRHLIGESAYRPVQVVNAPCREQEAAGLLTMLPALKCWPDEGGRFLTLPLVFTRDPKTAESNCGMYRAQNLGPDRLTLNWNPGSDGARHHDAWRRLDEPMPVAIALGGPPSAICAAAMPLPPGVDEMAMAGYLNGEPVPVAACGESGLTVPAEAEIVIEGLIEPGECALEGPFGNHTGFYTQPKECPVMRVTSMTHRTDPIYPCTVVGSPPMEDCYMARATERLLLPLWQRMFPALGDIHFPFEGIFHGCAVVAVKGNDPGCGAALIREMWQSSYFRSSRLLVAVDSNADIRNASGVFWRAINRIEAERDMMIDGERIGFDATGYLSKYGPAPSVREVHADEKVRDKVRRRWQDYGLED